MSRILILTTLAATIATLSATPREADWKQVAKAQAKDQPKTVLELLKPIESAAFAEKSVGYMGTNPDYISLLYPMTEVNKDVKGVSQIDKFLSRLQLAVRKVEDTRMLMGSDVVHAGVAYMHNAGEAAYRGQAEAEPIYKDLSDSYPGGNPTKAKKPAKQAIP